MRKLFYLAMVALLMAACASPSRMVKNQQYDNAIEKLSRNLRTGKIKDKDVKLLGQAFHTANQLDHDRIMLLRRSGQPDIWPEIYQRYAAMNHRQDLVKSLPEEVRQRINYRPIDYSTDMAEAINRASAYLYARAEQLLKSNDRNDARKAYFLLLELSQINRNYRDTDALIRQALMKGTNQVLLAFDNQTGMRLPEGFVDNVMLFNPADFKDEFISYDLFPVSGKQYDYTVYISLKNILISPERLESRSFTETAEIQDGTKPKRDENGRIVLDNDGNVIEVPNYRTVSAVVNETIMSKSATLEATIDYVQTGSSSVVYSIPVSANSNFTHAYATFNGDQNAISRETKRMVGNKPIPFPPDGNMLIEASRSLNQAVKRNLRRESDRMRE